MRFVLDPLSPTGISKAEQKNDGYRPYFAGGPGKPSLVDSVNGLTGAVQVGVRNLVDFDTSVAPVDGQAVVWNEADQVWEPGSVASDGTFTGDAVVFSVHQVAHGFTVGNIVRNNGSANTFAKAQADSAANAEVVGLVSTVTNADNFILTTAGLITTGVPSELAGTVLFLDPSTAGALTSTEPTTAGQISKPLAVVIEQSVRMIFNNFRGEVITDSSASGAVDVREVDGGPSVSGVSTIVVSNGTLTDNGGGQVTLSTGGGGGGTPGGSNTYVQYNDGGSFGGESTLAYNKTSNILTASGVSFSALYGAYTSKTANYTATVTDYFIACDATGGSFTITLPAASGNTGLHYFIKKIDTSGNTITIDGNASETIDGSTTRVINTQYETVGLICNGTNWYVI